MASSQTLSSLALLKVHMDQTGANYLDYLIPFVQSVIVEHKRDPVDKEDVQRFLLDDFGLRIPQHAVELLLRRLAKRDFLVSRNGVFHPGRLSDPRIQSKREEIQKRQAAFMAALVQYMDNKHGFKWTLDQATDALIAYLMQFSIDCLRAYEQGCALPRVLRSGPDQDFLINDFIGHIHESEERLFETLIEIVKGHMLANALICADLDLVTRKFRKVTFYLDTPFVLRLLGRPSNRRTNGVSR
jgi:hypothetical protein